MFQFAATWVTPNQYPLHVREYWAGLVRAVKQGLYYPEGIDKVLKSAQPTCSKLCDHTSRFNPSLTRRCCASVLLAG